MRNRIPSPSCVVFWFRRFGVFATYQVYYGRAKNELEKKVLVDSIPYVVERLTNCTFKLNPSELSKGRAGPSEDPLHLIKRDKQRLASRLLDRSKLVEDEGIRFLSFTGHKLNSVPHLDGRDLWPTKGRNKRVSNYGARAVRE